MHSSRDGEISLSTWLKLIPFVPSLLLGHSFVSFLHERDFLLDRPLIQSQPEPRARARAIPLIKSTGERGISTRVSRNYINRLLTVTRYDRSPPGMRGTIPGKYLRDHY